MLTSKLLRIEQALVDKVDTLATKLSETEYTSFSALARKLIRVGLDYIDSDRKDKRTVSIPKVHYSKLDGYGNPKTYNDTEIESIMTAIDCAHRAFDMENGEPGNHLTISWRTTDEKGEHFGIGIISDLSGLKAGDEIYIGLPNLYRLVVMGQGKPNEE